MHTYTVTFDPYLFRENGYTGEIPPLTYHSKCNLHTKTNNKDLFFSVLEYCTGNRVLVEICFNSIVKIIERK